MEQEPEIGRSERPDWIGVARRVLPTRRHAEMLFDAVRARLGEDAWVETAAGGALLRLFRREPGERRWIVPWPVLEVAFGRRVAVVTPPVRVGDRPPVPPAKAPPPRKLRGLGKGELAISEGDRSVSIAYGHDGQCCEVTMGHDRLMGQLRQLVGVNGADAVDRLTDIVVGLGPDRAGPGRLYLPLPVPVEARALWQQGLRVVRRASFEGRLPESARWAAADAFGLDTLGAGETPEQALAAWRIDAEHTEPWPATVEPSAAPNDAVEPVGDPGGPATHYRITLTAPSVDGEWPEPAVAHTPAVVVPLGRVPACEPPFGSWVRLLGGQGTPSVAVLRRDADGVTVIGEDAVQRIDGATLDAALDAVDLPGGSDTPWPDDLPPLDSSVVVYRPECDRGRVAREFSVETRSEKRGFDPGSLDGDALRSCVFRQRWRRDRQS